MKNHLSNIEFEIKQSRCYTILIALLHILAVVSVIAAQIPVLIQSSLILWVILQASINHRRHLAGQYPCTLSYIGTIGWQLKSKQAVHAIEIQSTTVITRFFVVVHYRKVLSNQGIESLVCFFDSLNAKEFKQLIVKLKIAQLQK